MIRPKPIIVLAKKELGYFFNSPVGWISVFLTAIFSNFLFMKDLFIRGDGNLKQMFEFLPWVLMIFIPTLTMRAFSEEKKNRTLEVLLSQPISEVEIVVGKSLSCLMVVFLMLVATLSVPFGLGIITSVVISEIAVSYLGVILMALSFIGIGVFVSSLTENQIIALLTTILTLFLLILLGTDFITSAFPDAIRAHLPTLAPMLHLNSFLKGVVDTRGIFYFFSIFIATTLMSVVNLKKRT